MKALIIIHGRRILTLAIIVLGFNACFVEDEYEEIYQIKGATPVISDIITGFYDLADIENAAIGFTINSEGEPVQSANILIGLNGGAAMPFKTIDIPSTMTISLIEAAGVVNADPSELDIGDEFVFAFEMITASGTYSSPSDFTILASCASDLAGTFDYVTTPWCGEDQASGTAIWTEVSEGVYTTEDFAYGAYDICYGPGSTLPGGSLTVNDVCNKITSAGTDRWGDTYTIIIVEVAGPSLTFSWSNTYGEAGTTTLTRQDGKDWPELHN